MKLLLTSAIVLLSSAVHADTVFCDTGDQLKGKVISVSETEVLLKSSVAGELKLPREKVHTIIFDLPPGKVPARFPVPATVPPPAPVPSADPSTGLLQGLKPEDVAKVQKEFLATATPEAQAMFNETLQGLLSGKVNIQDLRAQAQDALNQLNDLSADLGEDEGGELIGTYGAILQNFLKQTGGAPTNSAKPRPAAPTPEDSE